MNTTISAYRPREAVPVRPAPAYPALAGAGPARSIARAACSSCRPKSASVRGKFHEQPGQGAGILRIPFHEEGFPTLEQRAMGLRRLPCTERYGWLWAIPGDGTLDLDASLGELAADLAWLDGDALEIKAEKTSERRANWKILIEGGIEAYHFRVVHRNTIGPHFPNNLSSYRRFGTAIEVAGRIEGRFRQWPTRQASAVPIA